MVEKLPDGTIVYEVDEAAMPFFVEEKVGIKFLGGDGPVVVVLPDVRAIPLAFGLLTPPPSLKGTAAPLAGFTAGREPGTGRLVLGLHFPGNAVIHVVMDAAQEEEFYSSPRPPNNNIPPLVN